MSRKLAVSLLMVMLGLASWDLVLDHQDPLDAAAPAAEDTLEAKHDGAGSFPR